MSGVKKVERSRDALTVSGWLATVVLQHEIVQFRRKRAAISRSPGALTRGSNDSSLIECVETASGRRGRRSVIFWGTVPGFRPLGRQRGVLGPIPWPFTRSHPQVCARWGGFEPSLGFARPAAVAIRRGVSTSRGFGWRMGRGRRGPLERSRTLVRQPSPCADWRADPALTYGYVTNNLALRQRPIPGSRA